ncbi:BtrH N-terminal domain-containing protein, partial [Pricia sp.]|uniref:BtrH N-terminal domain-containing protein n=1 Tax=Pricia sp. TaxID=2268138 RepID=UPI003593A965
MSEPMLFGLGEGLGFIFWNMKTMDFPFIGGRVKPDLLTENLCRNLNLRLEVTEISSKPRALENAIKHIDQGKAVGLKLDCYHLEYFKNKIHFASHYVAFYAYDKEFGYLIDTDQQGGKVKTSL